MREFGIGVMTEHETSVFGHRCGADRIRGMHCAYKGDTPLIQPRLATVVI